MPEERGIISICMDTPKSYCSFVNSLTNGQGRHHKIYHERYGFPIKKDNDLFGLLLLEINQAGLSWDTILKKENNFRKAYSGFSVRKIAAYTSRDRRRLLSDAGIIRNRLKVDAAIHNAKIVLRLQKEHGSFRQWLDKQGTLSRNEWTALFKQTFRFVGGEIVKEFLMSSGYLPGAHDKKCKLYRRVLRSKPAWKKEHVYETA